MKKLTYQKYNGLENVITIDLHNGYTVIVITSCEKDIRYNSTFFLKDNTVDDWKLVQDLENVEFDIKTRNINSTILKYIATLLSDRFFDYYIDRMDYEYKCFDIGNELMEKERLEENNV